MLPRYSWKKDKEEFEKKYGRRAKYSPEAIEELEATKRRFFGLDK